LFLTLPVPPFRNPTQSEEGERNFIFLEKGRGEWIFPPPPRQKLKGGFKREVLNFKIINPELFIPTKKTIFFYDPLANGFFSVISVFFLCDLCVKQFHLPENLERKKYML